jgi:hypothetical protein
MKSVSTLAAAVSVLVLAGAASACPSPSPVVSIQYKVSEGPTDGLMASLTMPVQEILYQLDRATQVMSSTSLRTVDIEIQFEGETTEQDLATVVDRIEQLELADEVQIVSRVVELRLPSLIHTMCRSAGMTAEFTEVVVSETELRTNHGAVPDLPQLIELLKAHDIRKVKIRPLPGTSYEVIGKVIYGLGRAGMEMESDEPAHDG